MQIEIKEEIQKLEKKYGVGLSSLMTISGPNDFLDKVQKLRANNKKINGGVFCVSIICILLVLFVLPPDFNLIAFVPIYMLIYSIFSYSRRRRLINDLLKIFTNRIK